MSDDEDKEENHGTSFQEGEDVLAWGVHPDFFGLVEDWYKATIQAVTDEGYVVQIQYCSQGGPALQREEVLSAEHLKHQKTKISVLKARGGQTVTSDPTHMIPEAKWQASMVGYPNHIFFPELAENHVDPDIVISSTGFMTSGDDNDENGIKDNYPLLRLLRWAKANNQFIYNPNAWNNMTVSKEITGKDKNWMYVMDSAVRRCKVVARILPFQDDGGDEQTLGLEYDMAQKYNKPMLYIQGAFAYVLERKFGSIEGAKDDENISNDWAAEYDEVFNMLGTKGNLSKRTEEIVHRNFQNGLSSEAIRKHYGLRTRGDFFQTPQIPAYTAVDWSLQSMLDVPFYPGAIKHLEDQDREYEKEMARHGQAPEPKDVFAEEKRAWAEAKEREFAERGLGHFKLVDVVPSLEECEMAAMRLAASEDICASKVYRSKALAANMWYRPIRGTADHKHTVPHCLQGHDMELSCEYDEYREYRVVDEATGWEDIKQEGMSFECKHCGPVQGVFSNSDEVSKYWLCRPCAHKFCLQCVPEVASPERFESSESDEPSDDDTRSDVPDFCDPTDTAYFTGGRGAGSGWEEDAPEISAEEYAALGINTLDFEDTDKDEDKDEQEDKGPGWEDSPGEEDSEAIPEPYAFAAQADDFNPFEQPQGLSGPTSAEEDDGKADRVDQLSGMSGAQPSLVCPPEVQVSMSRDIVVETATLPAATPEPKVVDAGSREPPGLVQSHTASEPAGKTWRCPCW